MLSQQKLASISRHNSEAVSYKQTEAWKNNDHWQRGNTPRLLAPCMDSGAMGNSRPLARRPRGGVWNTPIFKSSSEAGWRGWPNICRWQAGSAGFRMSTSTARCGKHGQDGRTSTCPCRLWGLETGGRTISKVLANRPCAGLAQELLRQLAS